jgi:hypothetical protein
MGEHSCKLCRSARAILIRVDKGEKEGDWEAIYGIWVERRDMDMAVAGGGLLYSWESQRSKLLKTRPVDMKVGTSVLAGAWVLGTWVLNLEGLL